MAHALAKYYRLLFVIYLCVWMWMCVCPWVSLTVESFLMHFYFDYNLFVFISVHSGCFDHRFYFIFFPFPSPPLSISFLVFVFQALFTNTFDSYLPGILPDVRNETTTKKTGAQFRRPFNETNRNQNQKFVFGPKLPLVWHFVQFSNCIFQKMDRLLLFDWRNIF